MKLIHTELSARQVFTSGMEAYITWIELAAYALGTIGAALLFLELFQDPNYVTYNENSDRYRLQISVDTVREYTSLGRIGTFLIALAFALLFLATMLDG